MVTAHGCATLLCPSFRQPEYCVLDRETCLTVVIGK